MLPPQTLVEDTTFRPVTRSWIVHDLQELGVQPGGVLMVHLRLSALRYVIGGVDTVMYAVLEALGPHGTLVAFTGWDGSPFHAPLLPTSWGNAYHESCPPFDPACSTARRDFGCFPERVRTWPGALRSSHPEVSFAACGPLATWLISGTEDVDDPWGTSGVLGRLVQADGHVLLFGAPLNMLTLCHHAEALAKVPRKRFHEYHMPILVNGQTVWKAYRTLDTFYGALPYWDDPRLEIDSAIETLAQQAVKAAAGHAGMIAYAPSWLFRAPQTVHAVQRWLEATFGERSERST